jgi:DNA-binding transcriptional LysR family regulator
LGIVIGYDNSNSNVRAVRIADKSKLVMIAAPKFISGLKTKIEWMDLKDYPFVCGSPGSFLNQLILDKSKACGITPHIILDTFTPEYTKRFIIDGNGITIWHKKDVEKEIKEGQLVCLPLNEDITVPIDLIVPQDSKPHSFNIKKLIHELELNLNSPDTN